MPTVARAGSGTTVCPQVLSSHIPTRLPDAISGSAFARAIEGRSGPGREAAIRARLLAGDVPRFLRRLVPVRLHGRTPDDGEVHITVCVAPDYLAIGSNEDFLRIPMGLDTALAVSSRFGFVLPTRKIVDAIDGQAEVRLAPQPLPPGPRMRSTAYFWHHNGLIRTQRRALDAPLGVLTVGQKKDLVLTNRLWRHPGRVAIYGWPRLDGRPIQPLSTWHGEHYADYSHGVRLVSDIVFVHGTEPRSIFSVLRDPQLAPVLSYEGVIHDPLRLIESRGGQRPAIGALRSAVESAERAAAEPVLLARGRTTGAPH